MRSIKEAVKKVKPIHLLWVGLIGVCILLLIIAYQVRPIDDPIDPFPRRGASWNTGPIMSGETVSQKIVIDRPVRDIIIKIGTYGETLQQGKLRVKIISEETGETVYTTNFQGKKLKDNQDVILPGPTIFFSLLKTLGMTDRSVCIHCMNLRPLLGMSRTNNNTMTLSICATVTAQTRHLLFSIWNCLFWA